jgi:Co/Zn/Cd efflux system component
MAAFGAGVLVEIAVKLITGLVPSASLMEGIGLVALGANCVCLLLLSRHRADDVNMRSAWICSRNDVIANIGVLVAGLAVALTRSAWPDIVMGLAIAAMFGTSAVGVIRQAHAAWPPAPSARVGF